MGKLMKYLLKMILGSILVWSMIVLAYTEEFVFSQPEDTGEAVDTSGLADGVYAGNSVGFGGPIEIEVTIEGEKITEINVLSHSETDGISDPAFDEIPATMIENNSTEVDTVTGATNTSNGLIEAVNNALSGTPGASSEVEEVPATTVDVSEITDGTYSATVDGHNGDLEVDVDVEGGVITDVVVRDHAETDGLSDSAIEEVPAAIIGNNSTDVDTISGATVTSNAIIEAVNIALKNAQ